MPYGQYLRHHPGESCQGGGRTRLKERCRAAGSCAVHDSNVRSFAKLAAAVLVAASAGALAANVASTTAKPPVPAVEAVVISPLSYELSLENGLVAVTGGSVSGCQTRLLSPTSLRLVRTIDSCVTGSRMFDEPLVVDFKGLGDEIHVATSNPVTHKAGVGPLLMTVQNWGWAHSGVTSGDGAVWIFGLDTNTLLEVSTTTGRVVHRWAVNAGADPWMAVDSDGFWMTEGVWDGSFCQTNCTLWHVASGSDRLVALRRLGRGTQWFMASGHSLYVDELSGKARSGFMQTIWRMDGPSARVAYKTPGTLLPSTDFGGTGYVVEGDPKLGYFTLSELGKGHTPLGIGDCDSSAPLRVVRINPATGKQDYVTTVPSKDVGSQFDCHLFSYQSAFGDGALYFLSDSQEPGTHYEMVVRVSV
jgi:hypothetical protein